MTDGWLYRYEVKGIQAFILATDRLREMQGASALIEQLAGLFEEAREKVGLGGEERVLVPAVAGGASLKVAAADLPRLESLMAGWPMVVARHAPGLQVVQARVPAEAGMDSLHSALRGARSKLVAGFPEAGPLVMRAPRTGLPASELIDEPGDGPRRQVGADPASVRKRDAAENDVLGKRIDEDHLWIQDIDQLEHRYLGVVHADGNDLGQWVKDLAEKKGDKVLAEFSKHLAEATLKAVQSAVGEVLVKHGKRRDGRLAARPIVVGGDDVTFIVRADLAFEFAVEVLKEFCKLNADEGLTASAGVALVHKSHPFHLAHDLAEGLCKFAKKRMRGRGKDGQTPAAIAFHRLSTSGSESYDGLRKEALRGSLPKDLEGKAWLSLCPYTLEKVPGFACVDELEALVKVVDESLPAGPVRELIGLQQVDGERALALWKRIGEVQRDRDAANWKKCTDALAGLGVEDGWARLAGGGNDEWGSPFLDALTLARATDQD